MSIGLKRTVSAILCAVILLAAAPLNGFVGLHFSELRLSSLSSLFASKARAADPTSGTCGDGLTWDYDSSTDTLTISGTGAMNSYYYSYYNGTIVTTAPWRPYYNSMRTVIINSGVTSIGSYAFSDCTGLTSVKITDLESWCKISFSNASSNPLYYAHNLYLNDELVTDLIIPAGVTSIGDWAFINCTGLTSVTIPDSVTSIGYDAFFYCTGLTSVTIPDSVTSIGGNAFAHCTGLTSVKITDLESWCKISFYHYYSNPLYYAHNLYLNDELVTDLIIPAGVTSIGEDAFRACTGLTSVTIPDSVTSIGEDAFRACTGLTSVTIPDSVTSIGGYAFRDCTGLTSVKITDLESWCKISFGNFYSNPLYYAHKLYLNDELVTDLTIPIGITSIGNSVFYGCTGLTRVTIPNSVKSIHKEAFRDCTGLRSVTIGTGVTSIGKSAFYDCTGLRSVTIPDSVKSISDYAFYKCTGLTSVTIGTGVTSIGSYAFEYCTGLTVINYNAKYAADLTSSSDVFNNAGKSGTGITVTFGDAVERIPAYLFFESSSSDRPNIKAVTIGTGVTSIGDLAFYNCTGLTSVTIGDSVTSIGNFAFYDCTGLRSVTIPDSVTSIGENAFFNCTGLTEINYNAKNAADLTSSSYVFYNAGTSGTGISVTFGDAVESIPAYLFYGCTGLTSVTIPDSVTSIGSYAFDGCSALTDVYYNDSQEEWNKVFIGSNNVPLLSARMHYTVIFTVSYDANGGTGAPESQSKQQGQAITLSSAIPTREGYIFVCWNTAADGSEASYKPGARYAVNESVTLYAQWEPVAVPAQSSVLSAVPVSSEPYYIQGARKYLITVGNHPDKIQFILSSGSTKTFSKIQATVLDNSDGTENWIITASLKADDYMIKARVGGAWESAAFAFSIVYDEKPAVTNGRIISVRPVYDEPYYEKASRPYEIKVQGKADKIQFKNSSGTTITLSKTAAQIVNNADGTQVWTASASLKADTYIVKSKIGTAWIDSDYLYTVTYDARPAIDETAFTVDVSGKTATFTVTTAANAAKIQFVTDSGSTITFSAADYSVIGADGLRHWTVVRTVKTSGTGSYALKIKTSAWEDTGKSVFIN